MENEIRNKIVFIGDSGVGKTSIIKKMLPNNFTCGENQQLQ
jgi:GTPase SAR1 family protein